MFFSLLLLSTRLSLVFFKKMYTAVRLASLRAHEEISALPTLQEPRRSGRRAPKVARHAEKGRVEKGARAVPELALTRARRPQREARGCPRPQARAVNAETQLPKSGARACSLRLQRLWSQQSTLLYCLQRRGALGASRGTRAPRARPLGRRERSVVLFEARLPEEREKRHDTRPLLLLLLPPPAAPAESLLLQGESAPAQSSRSAALSPARHVEWGRRCCHYCAQQLRRSRRERGRRSSAAATAPPRFQKKSGEARGCHCSATRTATWKRRSLRFGSARSTPPPASVFFRPQPRPPRRRPTFWT